MAKCESQLSNLLNAVFQCHDSVPHYRLITDDSMTEEELQIYHEQIRKHVLQKLGILGDTLIQLEVIEE